jgi:hypothetical protein
MGKTSKMKAALIVTAAWMLSCAVLQGAERGFDDIVRAISSEFHARPLRIPFFGHIAVFENLDVDDQRSRDLVEAIRTTDGGWQPFVQVREHAETVLVYVAPGSSKCRMLVVAIEPGELTLVELKLSAHEMQVWLSQPAAAAVRNVSR